MPEWKIKRGDQEFTAGDDAMLIEWAQSGRVVPTDYVLNPTLQQWMYAKDAAELQGVFGVQTQSANRRAGCSITILGALLCLLFWPVGIIVLAVGIIMWGMAEAKVGR